MKKWITSLLATGMVAVMAVGVAGCGKKTAYDVAVSNGFTGTEEEWLLSLHGKNGEDGEDITAQTLYDTAVANGYEGTFLQFCETLNITLPKHNDTAQIAQNTSSVVSIYCGYSVTTTTNSGGIWGFGSGSKKTEYGYQSGSGVIVDLNKEAGTATILTNYHVVSNFGSDEGGKLSNVRVYPYGAINLFDPSLSAEELSAKGDTGCRATVIGGAMDYDIAVVKVEGVAALKNSVATEATFGDSEKNVVGEETYVIGDPAGAGIAVTDGILSVLSEWIGIYALDGRDTNNDSKVDVVPYRVLRTTAAINSGNSGGGIFNTSGELIGIVNAKNASSATDNMGYALPITQVKAVYENILRNGGVVKRARLGITTEVFSSTAKLEGDGIIVEEKFRVSVEPAEKSGEAAFGKLFYGDVIHSAAINGGTPFTFTRQYQITDFLLGVNVGDTVTFQITNASNQDKSVDITFGANHFTTFA